jgi:hypothetical protein
MSAAGRSVHQAAGRQFAFWTLKRHCGSELLLRKTDQRPYSARHNFLI